ncbi:hypothetical protein LU290_10500 [Moraxella nasibovis]|uniref:DsbA family protein n=1 Tax=Moraxella nasibovis TaxID=2904120 RepID=UPI0024107D38|nr:hypothetical protein [Moraxella nasibovis]WFF38647.1 hypothetical protein LU290_10500 [Moraxella nasibovis]
MQFIYLFDPLCGWCYASSKGIGELARTHDIDVYATGLFANTGKMIDAQFAHHAWSNNTRINQLTGLPFSENYRQLLLKGGEFNSFYLIVACVLLKNSKPDELLPVFSQLQKMRYVHGLDTSRLAVVKNGLIALEQTDIAEKLENADSQKLANDWIAQGQKLAYQFAINGVPSLIAKTDKGYVNIPSQFLYQDTENVAKNIEQFLSQI